MLDGSIAPENVKIEGIETEEEKHRIQVLHIIDNIHITNFIN